MAEYFRCYASQPGHLLNYTLDGALTSVINYEHVIGGQFGLERVTPTILEKHQLSQEISDQGIQHQRTRPICKKKKNYSAHRQKGKNTQQRNGMKREEIVGKWRKKMAQKLKIFGLIRRILWKKTEKIKE